MCHVVAGRRSSTPLRIHRDLRPCVTAEPSFVAKCILKNAVSILHRGHKICLGGGWYKTLEGREGAEGEKDSEENLKECAGYRSASASSSGSLNFSIAAFISPISALDGFRSSAIEK